MPNSLLTFGELCGRIALCTTFRLQTDGQNEVVNRSLENLLQCLVGDHLKSWDAILHLAEFAYNSSLNRTIKTSPFEVVYGLRPSSIVDIAPLLDQGKRKSRIYG